MMMNKKKTLRVAVLASIFAMAFSATAWGATSADSNAVNIPTRDVHPSAVWDGAYKPDEPDAIFSSSRNSPVAMSHLEEVSRYQDTNNKTIIKYRVKGTTDSFFYGTVLQRRDGEHLVINLDIRSEDNVHDLDGTMISIPKGNPPAQYSVEYMEMMQIYNMDYAATITGFESEDRVASDKLLANDDVKNISVNTNGNTLTVGLSFRDGETISAGVDLSEFAKDTDTNTTNDSLNVNLTENGELSVTVNDSADNNVSGKVDIAGYINTEIINNAGDAKITVNDNETTINNAINNNTQNITNNTTAINNINDNNVTKIVQNDEHTWNITQKIDGVDTPVTIKDTTLVASEEGLGFNDGKINLTVTDTDNNSVTGAVDISGYVGDKIKKEAANATYNSTTIGEAITENTNNITKINQTIGNVNEFKDGVKNTNNETTTIVDAINNTYDVAKKHTTVDEGKNITVTESTNADGGKHYVIATSDKVDFTEVTIGNEGSKITINNNGINMNNKSITNITNLSAQTITATTSVTTPTIIMGDSTITYNTEENRIQYVDGDNTYKIAHIGDGYTFVTDDGNVTHVLNSQVNIKGGANINTMVDQGVIKVNLNESLTGLTSVTSQTINGDNVNVKNEFKVGESTNALTINKEGSITNVTNISTDQITLEGDTNNTVIDYDGDRITYVDGDNNPQEIANLNDGKYYLGDGTTTTDLIRIKDDVTIKGGAATGNLSENNIGVVAEGSTLNVRLSKDVTGLNSVTSETVNVGEDVTINNNGMTIQGDTIENNVVINKNEVNVGGNKIENVAPGELSPTSMDAVNGSQLYETNQRLDKLGGRVDKVGAGAAALAALHPLDFDPDDKLSFSAGVGNYGGETATALGAFYRPTEKVMLSAAGTMGNGENMVNMGVSFALDRKNNVSNSRVAMAREIQDLREQVAALTALVTQLAGKTNPVVDAVMFPDVPENHWAYDYIESLQKRGIIEGYPDGNFGGDRSMTRYEYAAMLWRALEQGFPVDSRLLDEFDAELGRIRIDRIKGEDNDANKTERVRVNDFEDRDDYGSKIINVAAK